MNKTAIALLASCLLCSHAAAAPWSVRLSLEPGVSRLRPPQAREGNLGSSRGAALALGVTDLAWIQLLVDQGDLGAPARTSRYDAWAGSVLYTMDVLPVTPFVELGVGRLSFRGVESAEVLPVLGIGVDWRVLSWLELGAVARYWPAFESDLRQPALASWSLRVSGVLE